MSEKVEVFCDFDGTITVGDTVDILLEELADPEWQNIEQLWIKGEIGSRECMALQIALIKGGWPAILQVLETVQIDPTFAKFAKWCKHHGVPLSIVSDGIDKVIHHILKREQITVDNIRANHLEENEDGSVRLTFPCPPQIQGCSSGMCKCRILNNGPAKPKKIVIGDGRSDFCWASEADLVFAKSKLLTHCQSYRMNCIEFQDFVSVRAELERLIVPAPQYLPEPQFVPSLVQVG